MFTEGLWVQKGSEGVEQLLLQCVQMCMETPPALDEAPALSQNRGIREWFGLEGTFKDHLVQLDGLDMGRDICH